MSSLLFPSAQAGAYIASKEPYQDVRIDEAASGKEVRSTWQLAPRWKYNVRFDLLRSAASSPQELQQLLMQFLRHAGQWDSFLLDDPEDDSVTDMGFGVGDGATTAFQLQRLVAGKVTDRAGFSYAPQSKPFVNLLRNSSFETDSNADGLADNWNAYNNTASTEPSQWTIVPGANGGKAQRVSWGISNTTSKGVTAAVQTVGIWAGFVVGQWYTGSFVARAQGGLVGITDAAVNFDVFPANFVTVAQPTLTAGWQRYVFQFKWNAGQVPTANFYMTVHFGAGVLGDLDFDLVQVTPGQWGLTDLQPLETAAAAAGTDTPAYWPAQTDGFEPIYELSSAPTLYQDGDWMGRRTVYAYARTNLLGLSEQLDNASWTKTNASVGANAIAAPDGTTTADQFNEGVAVTVQHYTASPAFTSDVQGELRCYSVFVKANNLPNITWGVVTDSSGINFNLGTGVVDGAVGGVIVASGVITSPLWPGWFRIWFVRRANANLATTAFLAGRGDGSYTASYTGTSRTFYAWGAMCERVSNLSGPTPYIKTPTSAAVTVTDYTLNSLGLATLATAPPSGAYLSADVGFYKRVRLAQPGLPLQRIVQSMWATGIDLVTVKGT